MTPNQKARYNRDLRIWEFRKKNPDMDLQDIAPIFNLGNGGSVSDALKRMDRHINHGEPYVKPIDYSKRKRPTGMTYNKPERLDFRTTKNPEQAWEQALGQGAFN